MAVNVTTEILLQDLLCLFGLAIGLWAIRAVKTMLHRQQAQKLLPDLGSELHPLVHPHTAHGSEMHAAKTTVVSKGLGTTSLVEQK